MKHITKIITTIFVLGISCMVFGQTDDDIISIYEGSRVRYDDKIGFEEYPVVVNENSVQVMEGILRRQWCQAPEERSPLEIIRNYESTIKNSGGEILFKTREPRSVEIDDKKLSEYFSAHRRDRGLATNVFSYTHFPEGMSEFLTARLTTPESEVYVVVASGSGHWAAKQDNTTYFEIITLEVEAMDMGMVTLDGIKEGLKVYGRVPVYNIYFETGKSDVMDKSDVALKIIAEFLKEYASDRFFVVGHTDFAGDYEMNMELSRARATAVTEKLVSNYGVNKDQLKPVGVGPASPVMSNATEEGKAKNRRVEIVER